MTLLVPIHRHMFKFTNTWGRGEVNLKIREDVIEQKLHFLDEFSKGELTSMHSATYINGQEPNMMCPMFAKRCISDLLLFAIALSHKKKTRGCRVLCSGPTQCTHLSSTPKNKTIQQVNI